MITHLSSALSRCVADAPVGKSFRIAAAVAGRPANLALAVLLLSSCDQSKIQVYRIPKENVQVAMESGSGAIVPPPPSAPVKWTKPEGWEEQPLSEMRQGSFRASGPNGKTADISVVSFPGDAGGVESNVNRWRSQVQLPPLASEAIGGAVQHLTVNGKDALLVDVQTPNGAGKPARILGAILQTANRSWFVKMTGDPDFLESQKPRFLEFVQSFEFANTPAAAGEDAAPNTVKSTNDKQ